MTRHQITDTDIEKCVVELIDAIDFRLNQKGHGIFVSQHEIRGAIDEEFDEYHEAVHLNDHHEQKKELMDIAVAAMVGIISIDSGKMEW